jgi:1,4-alpha-glucan branching enzyme
MRKVIGITILLFVSGFVRAQLLITDPLFPKDTGRVTIIADFNRGNKGLLNYGNTNDVYVHIGVITSASSGPADWRYVRFAWGTTNDTARATSLGGNRYSYSIDTIRSFFKVPPTENIIKIAILFRNGNGSLVQRNADNSDMYVSVYSDALAAKFTEPFFQPKYRPVPEPITINAGENLPIRYESTGADTMRLYLDGVALIQKLYTYTVDATPTIATPGLHTVVGLAKTGTFIYADTFQFFIAPPVTVAPLPPGVRDGINYEQGDTSAILVLHAPDKGRVSVLGDFNNWTENTSYQMNKTPDGQRFWLRITGLTPGTEYAYQYLVDDNLRIADPYTQKVLDPNNDQHITAATYPNLKPYPTGKTTGNTSVLQTAEPGYNWQVNNFARPDKRNLVIYEMLLRDFVAAHDWKTLKDTLSYLKTLGVNAIELMPFNEFEGNLSWGYNTSFYFAPDKYYGPKNRLKEFVDECHKNGIAVIMDIALNHAFGQSPMVQLYWNGALNRPDITNPWYNPVPKHAFNVGYDMNHESLATRAFTSRVVEHWLKEYKLDGFRFDLSKGFTQNATCDANGGNCDVNAMGNYDASRVAIWKRYYDTVQNKSNGAYVILEHFAANNEETELSNYGMMFWGNLNHSFNQATMGKPQDWNFEWAIHTVRGWNNPHVVAYMESHDEDRLMVRNLASGNSSGTYNIRDLATALKRNEAAAAFFLMIPGPKMIWQFGEMGYDYSINYCISDGSIKDECRTGEKPIKWDYMQNAGRKRLHDIYAGLIKLRSHPWYKDAFTSNRIDRNLTGAVKWLKITTDTSNILVIANFDVVQASGTVSFQGPGTWYDYISGGTISPSGSAQTITLQPGEYHVYLNRNVTSIMTPVFDIGNTENTRLHIYPNPVYKSAILEYELRVNAPITISLLDMYGRKIQQLYAGFKVKGSYQLPVAAGHLTKGVYFVQLEYGKKRQLQKIVVSSE